MQTKNYLNKSTLSKLRWTNMVQALIKIDENTNRVLNIVKAKYNLNDKGEAVQFVVSEYIENKDEPELRPEYIEKAKKIMKQKVIKVGTIEDFRERYNIK